MKKKLNIIASAFLITLAVMSVVSAFGVSAPYWDGNPLTMARGDTVTVNLNLQNMVGDGDVNVKAELVSGAEITSLRQDTFTVEAGTHDTIVPLEVKMPKDAPVGESKSIIVEFKTVSPDTGGIAMGTGMTVSFNAVAGEEEAESNMVRNVAIVVIVLAALIIWALKKKKRK